MKRFKFGLDSVLTVRKFAKQQAANALAEASRRRQRAVLRLENLEGSLARKEGELRSLMQVGATIHQFILMQNDLKAERASRPELVKEVRESMDAEIAAREMALKAQREEKALLKLESKKRLEALKEWEAENEKEVEAFVNSQRARKGENG